MLNEFMVNINDYVEVQLTQYGLGLLAERLERDLYSYENISQQAFETISDGNNRKLARIRDNNLVYRDQLHVFMRDFGDYCHATSEQWYQGDIKMIGTLIY